MMDRKTRKAQKRAEKLRRKTLKLANAGKFTRWRNRRPFWGATLTLLAAALISYIPLHLYAIAFIPGSLVFIGFLFSGLLLFAGIFSYIYPQFSTILGVITIFISVLSIMGALGGFVIGSIIGIIGGALCVAWEKKEIAVDHVDDGGTPNKKGKKQKQIIQEEGTNSIQA